MMRGTTNRTLSCKKGSFQSRKSSASTAKVISISSSECDGSFQELSSRQSSRSNQILTVTDMASLRGRSYKICITSGSIHLALDSHLLVRIRSKLTCLREAETSLICHIYR